MPLTRYWPVLAGIAVVATRHGSDSLRHRREERHGYALRGEELDVGSEAFLRAAEAMISAPISHGNDLELLVNGDEISRRSSTPSQPRGGH